MTTRRGDAHALLFAIRGCTSAALLVPMACQFPPGSDLDPASGQVRAKTLQSGELTSSVLASAPSSDRHATSSVAAPRRNRGTAALGSAQRPVVGYLLGDPPYVEGWDPEEETCVSGNWCGDAAKAKLLVRPGMEAQKYQTMGCPNKLMGSSKADLSDPAYRGLSSDISMRGTFQSWRTAKARSAEKAPELCCYHWFEYCSGRALEQGVRSQEARAAAWDRACEAICDPVAMALARAYWDDADDEYDAVAALARASLELFALGAPEDLIEGCQRASLDELAHARMAQSISYHFVGHTWSRRAAAKVEPRFGGLGPLPCETFSEACVGETLAALRVARQAQGVRSAWLHRQLMRIAKDETRHAALGWKVLRWGFFRATPAERAMLRAHVEQIGRQIMRPRSPAPARPQEASPAWALGGRLTASQQRAASRDAWLGVCEPLLEELGRRGDQGVSA